MTNLNATASAGSPVARGHARVAHLTRLMKHVASAAACSAAALSLLATAAPPPVPEVLHYKFNGTGQTVTNYAVGVSPAPATGSITGLPTQGNPITGTGIMGLNGTGGQSHIDNVNTGWAPNLTGSWSISLVTANINNTASTNFILGDPFTNTFRMFANGAAGAGNLILRGAGLTDVHINGGAVVAPKVITFVYDQPNNQVRGYLDGALVTTVAQGAVALVGPGPLILSGYGISIGLPAGGQLGDVRIYNRALTATEVTDIYTAVFVLPQTLTFGAAPMVAVNGTGTVTATSALPNSGNPITFSTTSTDCSVTSAGMVTGINAGSNNCVITATQAGDSTYTAGTATQTLSIGMATQTLSFPAQMPASHFFVLNSTFPINPLATSATPNSGNAVVYSSLTGMVCSVSGTTVTMLTAGACQIAADQAGNANYSAATQVTQSVTLSSGVTVGGNVSGLVGTGLVLSLNGGAQFAPVASNGAFAFPNPVPNGSSYTVTIASQPQLASCVVGNSTGVTGSTNVVNVTVVCAANQAIEVPTQQPWVLMLLSLLLLGTGARVAVARRSAR